MQNYNQQQQAVILKEIAQQLLSMNVPSFGQAEKLFKEFGIDLFGYSGEEVDRAIMACIIASKELQGKIKGDNFGQKAHTVLHHTLNSKHSHEVAGKLGE